MKPVSNAGEARAAADAIARGFQDNEVWVWLVPGERARARVERRCYRSMVRRTFLPRGTAWMTVADGGRVTGGALWLPPGDRAARGIDLLARNLPFLPEGLPALGKAARLGKAVAARTPKQPHWYLETLAIEPGSREMGHGSVLIRPGLERADRDLAGVWLETQRRSNIGFYERFGFRVVEEFAVAPGLPLWTMWREPRRRSTH